jgi:hypothetical protein
MLLERQRSVATSEIHGNCFLFIDLWYLRWLKTCSRVLGLLFSKPENNIYSLQCHISANIDFSSSLSNWCIWSRPEKR